jgi:hypothetical protein
VGTGLCGDGIVWGRDCVGTGLCGDGIVWGRDCVGAGLCGDGIVWGRVSDPSKADHVGTAALGCPGRAIARRRFEKARLQQRNTKP